MKDYYHVLGITPRADARTVRKAWLVKARQFHPDHHPDDPTSEEFFKEAQEAYRILSDPLLRARYDQAGYESLIAPDAPGIIINHYFYVKSNRHSMQQFEEVEITFTYTGQGKLFKKPSFRGYFQTGVPYVKHRTVIHQGHQLRETTFRYVLCPVQTGDLIIDRAAITIDHQVFYTDVLHIKVESNHCFFTDEHLPDGKPMKITLHYDFENEKVAAPVSESKKNHMILIPRSQTAFIFHTIGTTMKIVFTIWGAVTCKYYFDFPLIAGALAGNFLGGMNVMVMYRMAGIESKNTGIRKYPLVKQYLERGFHLGEATGLPLVRGNPAYWLKRILF